MILPFIACTHEEAAPVDETAPLPYVYDEDDPPAPSLSAEAVGEGIEAAAALVLGLHAKPVIAAYQAAMAGAEAGCPDWYDSEGTTYWYDQCTASTGATYEGYGFAVAYEDYAADGTLYDGDAVQGVARVVTAEGRTLELGGAAWVLAGTPAGIDPQDPGYYEVHTTVVQGGFAWDGPEAAGTWLETGRAPDLQAWAYVAPAYEGKVVYVDGGVSGLDGDADTVVFSELMLMSEGLVPECPGEPAGTVSLRDAAGEWVDVVFDGPADLGEPVDAERCDGCGEAFFRGESMGEACADLSALLAWEGAPW